MFNFIFIF